MIEFFRKIRYRLLSEMKFSNYLVYAIGEIILVVIGILIALQINNWNEGRKKRVQEVTILKNIQQDLLLDTLDISVAIILNKRFFKEEKALLSYLYSDDTIPTTSIDYNNALSSPTVAIIHQSSFNNLQNNDLGIVTNNNLKKQITRHYDFFVKMVLITVNELEPYNTYSAKLPYFLKYFKAIDKMQLLSTKELNTKEYLNPDVIRNRLEITDLKGLKEDEAFKIILSETSSMTQTKIEVYEEFLDRTKILVKAIDLEINNLLN